MPSQALARTFRPKQFSEVVGQPIVLAALTNALSQGRLHHAYLFTGSRGVGKTTVGRLFAKGLSCNTGVTATPCGVCAHCIAIDQNNFPDLIEIDAASRTKVEDMRELLENIHYLPHRGRYRVYLIDEVHMLSNHSFNALLKTLEEPPEHVIFLLATTDPKQLPVTILSRCLQLHLRNLNPDEIEQHLLTVLQQEHTEYDLAAIKRLSHAADGSVRDALSLLDQAIAIGNGRVLSDSVDAMLGCGSIQTLHSLLQQVIQKDAPASISTVSELTLQGVDFEQTLGELIHILHQIALLQTIGSLETEPQLQQYAQQCTSADIQLLYQIALMGRKDLPYTPHPRIGFEMTILRMIAFLPKDTQLLQIPISTDSATTPTSQPSAVSVQPTIIPEPSASPAKPTPSPSMALADIPTEDTYWAEIVTQLPLTGVARALAQNCSVAHRDHHAFMLTIDQSHAALNQEKHRARIQETLCDFLGTPVTVTISTGTVGITPIYIAQAKQAAEHAQMIHVLEQDPNIQTMQQIFGARIQPDSSNQ